MGLLDLFFGEARNIQRHHRRVTNIDTAEEDREASVQWLSKNGSPQALLALMARFDLTLDHQLKDSTEKDRTYDVLKGHGDKVIEPARVFLKTCRNTARPLQLLSEVAGQDAAFQAVYELLDHEKKTGTDFKPEKKKRLLVWLSEHRHAGALAAALPFLDDFDENVRYAAAEVVINQDDDAGRGPLEGMLANEDEESNRLRARLAEVFANKRWSLAAPDRVAARLPAGYVVRDGRIVKA
jgi:hypothetical protein